MNGEEGKEVRTECIAKGQPPPKVIWRQKGGEYFINFIKNSNNNLKSMIIREYNSRTSASHPFTNKGNLWRLGMHCFQWSST